ncbi:MAG: class I SAM-dependent methyltransferase [Candidatus Bathyarchaeia archaeon]
MNREVKPGVRKQISPIYDKESKSYVQKRIWMSSYIFVKIIRAIYYAVNLIVQKYGTKVKVLNLGSGPGWLEANLLQNNFKECFWLSLDIAPSMAKKAKLSGPNDVITADAHFLPFKDNTFDVIITTRAIKFLNRYTLLTEAKRVLKSQGFLLILFDCGDALWIRFLEKFGVLVDVGVNRRTLTTKELTSELRSFGFKILLLCPITSLPLSLFTHIPKLLWGVLKLIDLPRLIRPRLNMILAVREI